MLDVAREADVSSQTVSRVANGLTNVDARTRDRVLEAMRRLDYRPNRAARALRSGRFRTIGVVLFTLSSYGNMRTLDAIAGAASRAGYSITLLPVLNPTQGEVSSAIDRLNEQAVDGVVIIVESHLLDERDLDLPPGVPAVVIDSAGRSDHAVVDTDQTLGARLATQHLLDLGHPTVHHIAGPENSYSAARRRAAWEQTLRDAGIEPPPVLGGDWTTDSGYRHGLTLAADASVSAVFASNDQMALGALRALHERGRSVPDEVSVVGFDDMAESSAFWPPLTTVRQHFDRVGEYAVAALLHEIESHDRLADRMVGVELVPRASSAAYRAR